LITGPQYRTVDGRGASFTESGRKKGNLTADEKKRSIF